MKRDPITAKPSNGSGNASRPDANRNKGAGSAGPSFSRGNEDMRSFPAPSNPYKG